MRFADWNCPRCGTRQSSARIFCTCSAPRQGDMHWPFKYNEETGGFDYKPDEFPEDDGKPIK